MSVIEFDNINLVIGKNQILDNVSFKVNKGSIFGLIGYNGAGKTSLLRLLLGLNQHYDGCIRLFGDDDINRQRQRIGTVIDSLNLDLKCNAEDYLFRLGSLYRNFDKKDISELIELVGLNNVCKKNIHSYSMGMKKRLSIAAALLGNPELLILDEPFNGVDIEGMNELRLVLQELAMNGVTILVTSHIIPELIKLADTFGVLYHGRFLGTLSEETLLHMPNYKLTVRVNNVRHFYNDIKKMYSSVCCVSQHVGTVSLLGQDDIGIFDNILMQYNVQRDNVRKEIMSEEENLLYMMNGNCI